MASAAARSYLGLHDVDMDSMHLPGYTGFVPKRRTVVGKTFARSSTQSHSSSRRSVFSPIRMDVKAQANSGSRERVFGRRGAPPAYRCVSGYTGFKPCARDKVGYNSRKLAEGSALEASGMRYSLEKKQKRIHKEGKRVRREIRHHEKHVSSDGGKRSFWAEKPFNPTGLRVCGTTTFVPGQEEKFGVSLTHEAVQKQKASTMMVPRPSTAPGRSRSARLFPPGYTGHRPESERPIGKGLWRPEPAWKPPGLEDDVDKAARKIRAPALGYTGHVPRTQDIFGVNKTRIQQMATMGRDARPQTAPTRGRLPTTTFTEFSKGDRLSTGGLFA